MEACALQVSDDASRTAFPTCQVDLGISVLCRTPMRHKLFPLAPQPLVGLKDLLHLQQTESEVSVIQIQH